MTFGLLLATFLLITHVKKQRNRMCQKWVRSAFKSQQVQFQNHRNCSLSTAQTFGHYSKPIVNMITDPAIEFEWIAIEMSESLRGGKGPVSVILEKGLVVIWRHLSHFWHFRFLCFLTWVMRRTVANNNPKVIHFDTVDFSGHHSKKL